MVDGGWRAGWNPGFGGLVGIQVLGPGGNPGFGAWWESRFRAFGKPGLGAGGKHSGTHRIWPPCYSHVHLLQPTADVHAAAMCGPHWICGCTHPASLTLYPSQPASQPAFTKPLLHPPILPPTKSLDTGVSTVLLGLDIEKDQSTPLYHMRLTLATTTSHIPYSLKPWEHKPCELLRTPPTLMTTRGPATAQLTSTPASTQLSVCFT